MSSSDKAKISSLPVRVRDTSIIQRLDPENTGTIGITDAMQTLIASHEKNKSMSKILMGLGFCMLLLITSIFGVSVAAAYLAKESAVDPETGYMYTRGDSHKLISTGEAATFKSFDQSSLSTLDLVKLKTLFFNDYDVSFSIKGYSRSSTHDRVIFLVEGGRIEFEGDVVVGVTGEAQILFENIGVDMSEKNGRNLKEGNIVAKYSESRENSIYENSNNRRGEMKLTQEEKKLLRKSKTFGIRQEIFSSLRSETIENIKATIKYMSELTSHERSQCENKFIACSFFAAMGKCKNDINYMKSNCSPSCESCTLVLKPVTTPDFTEASTTVSVSSITVTVSPSVSPTSNATDSTTSDPTDGLCGEICQNLSEGETACIYQKKSNDQIESKCVDSEISGSIDECLMYPVDHDGIYTAWCVG